MSCVAMSVGLGNIWRFPFTAYENGGGAFLIPYIIILTIIGRPLYYMEMSLGQFSNRGNIKFFKSLSPYLKGWYHFLFVQRTKEKRQKRFFRLYKEISWQDNQIKRKFTITLCLTKWR